MTNIIPTGRHACDQGSLMGFWQMSPFSKLAALSDISYPTVEPIISSLRMGPPPQWFTVDFKVMCKPESCSNILHSQEKNTNWLKNPNDTPWVLLAFFRLCVGALTLSSWPFGEISGVESIQSSQAGMAILVSPQLSGCVDEWIPLKGCTC